MSENEWIGLTLFIVLLLCLSIWAWRRKNRNELEDLLARAENSSLSARYKELQGLALAFEDRSKGDFFTKWERSLSQRRRQSGTPMAVLQGLGDVLTVGQTERRRQLAKEFEAAVAIAELGHDLCGVASDDIRTHSIRTGKRIDLGFKLLEKSHRLTHPLLTEADFPKAPALSRARLLRLQRRSATLLRQRNSFLLVASSAGAGTATAVGLWGVVQVAGHASTGAAMIGLHGAAASSAGWAWFGGGSLATHGGGMALGHIVLPGVGVAITWAALVAQLARDANEMSARLQQVERYHKDTLPALARLIEAEQIYSNAAEEVRSALASLFLEVERANRKLRPLGSFSDWHRRRRGLRGHPCYTRKEMDLVERVAGAVDRFLDRLPASEM